MGLFDNIFGTNPQFTVKDNKTGEETQVRDPKELEKIAAKLQEKDPEKPRPFFERLFSK